jgi:hypothetical protein
MRRVAKAAKETASSRLEIGWAELIEGRSDAARAVFEDALAADETPEAFEGRLLRAACSVFVREDAVERLARL